MSVILAPGQCMILKIALTHMMPTAIAIVVSAVFSLEELASFKDEPNHEKEKLKLVLNQKLIALMLRDNA